MNAKLFLACGTLAPLIYLGTVLFGAHNYPGYSPLLQSVSELIAKGAPGKTVLDVVFSICGMLTALFSFGIQLLANRTFRPLARQAARHGAFILAGISLLGFSTLLFPMDPPSSSHSLYGIIHIVSACLMSAGSLPAIFLIACWLYDQPDFLKLARYSFVTSGLLLVVGSITALIYFSDFYLLGIFERLTFLIFFQWLLVAAWKLTRSETVTIRENSTYLQPDTPRKRSFGIF
ncbi:MAG: DUF998 domain-containing protein [Anaerolineaceae bacterium]